MSDPVAAKAAAAYRADLARRIKNSARSKLVTDQFWVQQQIQAFPNAIYTVKTPVDSYNAIVQEENAMLDIPAQRQTLALNIAKLSNSQTAEQIVDDLGDEQVTILNSLWSGFVTRFKSEFRRGQVIPYHVFRNSVMAFIDSRIPSSRQFNDAAGIIADGIDNAANQVAAQVANAAGMVMKGKTATAYSPASFAGSSPESSDESGNLAFREWVNPLARNTTARRGRKPGDRGNPIPPFRYEQIDVTQAYEKLGLLMNSYQRHDPTMVREAIQELHGRIDPKCEGIRTPADLQRLRVSKRDMSAIYTLLKDEAPAAVRSDFDRKAGGPSGASGSSPPRSANRVIRERRGDVVNDSADQELYDSIASLRRVFSDSDTDNVPRGRHPGGGGPSGWDSTEDDGGRGLVVRIKKTKKNNKKKKITGKGFNIEAAASIGNPKYYVDQKKLRESILAVKYKSNHQLRMKPVVVSRDVRGMVQELLHGRFNEQLYSHLNDGDKKVWGYFAAKMGLPNIGGADPIGQLVGDWQVLRGEYLSGNDNSEIRRKLKSLTLQLLDIGRVSKASAYNTLYALSV